MKFELKKISYNSRLSEETSAYTAELWVDGRALCIVSNHGTGGPDNQYPAKGRTQADIEAVDAYLKSLPAVDTGMKIDGKPFMMGQDIETKCGELLTDYLIERDMKRALKRTIYFVDPASGKLLNYKGKIEGVQRAHLITETLRKKPGAIILNNLPEAEALAIWKKAA